MKGVCKLSIWVRSDLPPHPHDKKIMRMYKQLHALIKERAAHWISAANKGKPKSVEHRAKISAARRNLGFKHTDEAKAKMSAARKGRTLSPATRAKISRSLLERATV